MDRNPLTKSKMEEGGIDEDKKRSSVNGTVGKGKKRGSLRGPTKDYREFEGQYGGRAYSYTRIMLTNFRELASSRWSIGVMIISFLFVFFNILTLVFGGGEEDLLAQFDQLDPEVLFWIEPIDGQEGRISVNLGDTYTLSYKVTNTGKEKDGLNVLVLPPNSNWETDHWIEGDRMLGKGDSVIVHVNVTIPGSVSEFAAQGDLDVFRNLGYSGWMEGEIISYSRPYSDKGDDIPIGRETPSANAVYQSNTSRIMGIAVIPDLLMDEISDYGFDNIDIRIRSTGTLLMLDPSDTDVSEELGIDTDTSPSNLRIWMGSDDDKVYRKSMTAPQIKEHKVHLKNIGQEPLQIELDCFLMPITDPSWVVFIMDPEQMEVNDPVITLGPGEEWEVMITLQTGEAPYKAHYSLLITATDITNGSFHVSDAYHMTVSISGSSYAPQEPGERYHGMLWGGGFNYERYLWLILLSAFAGAGVIAKDLQENSIALYLSRPITWYDYLLAKFSSLVLLLSLITIIPAMVLFSTGMAFSTKDIIYIIEHLYILGGMIASYFVALMVFASVCMAFSTLMKKWIFSGVGIFVFFIFSSTVSDILQGLFNNDYLKLLNVNLVMTKLFMPLFGLKYPTSEVGLDWYWLLLTLVGLVAGSWLLVISRFRKKEVAR